MNIFLVFAHIIVLFYLMYCFYETGFGRYHTDAQRVTLHALSAAICCMIALFLPLSFVFILFTVILFVYPIIAYYREQGFIRLYLYWCLFIGLSFIFICVIRYFVSILPNSPYSFHLCLDLLQINILSLIIIAYFQKINKVKSSPYAVIVNVGLSLVLFLNLMNYYDAAKEMASFVLLLPCALLLCFMILFRGFYVINQREESILKLTIKRYAEKENREKYESLEKENKMIMQQLHDMKKHLQILDDMEKHDEDTKTYQQEIIAKAEELLYMKQTGVPMIERILQTYRPRFQAANIQCNVEVDEIDFGFMNTIDLSAMLANMLDNALESCLKCEERFVLLKIKKQRDMIIVKMKNSCMQIQEEQGVLKTTKSDLVFHGYGMRNINMIARKYQGTLKYHFDSEHHIFITTISLFPDHS